MAWTPNGPWKQLFRDALESAFDAPSITLLISDYFSPESFPNIAPVGLQTTFRYQLYQLIEYARKEDWLLDLLAAAHERRPRNPALTELAAERGLTAAGPRLLNISASPLEEIVKAHAKFINPAVFTERLPLLEGRVCWVDIPGGGGTGFLVAPDVVLTNQHVTRRIASGAAAWSDVSCTFDFKLALDGTPVDKKKLRRVKLHSAAGWEIFSKPPSAHDSDPTLGDPAPEEIDCTLIRLAESIGAEPVGGATADAIAEDRGWIDVKTPPQTPLAKGNHVFLLQHPAGEAQQLSVGVVDRFNANATRVRYDANTKKGSSGAPCFNADLELVALHHSHDPEYPPKWNQAVPLTVLQRVWTQNGVTF